MQLGDFLAGSAAAAAAGTNAQAAERAPPPPSWTVWGTKKGGLPVSVETRKNGKVVVISNVDGDLNALLTDVKRALGTGGVARPDDGYVEVQGSHHETTVRNFLLRSGRLVGVNKGAILEAASKKTSAKNSKSSAGPRSRGSDGKAALNAKAAPQPTKPIIAVETTDIPDAKKIKAMKPPELKAHLQARGVSTQGNKKELIARLLALKVS